MSITHSIFLMVGDHTNPILKPAASAQVKKNGEIQRGGQNFLTPGNSCWPWSPPYTWRATALQIVQGKDEVVLLTLADHQIRRVRMNQEHPAHLTPSWSGNSVGHYEGDTLVIDTVDIKAAPISIVDAFGTPHSEALHIIERIRLVDADIANNAAARDEAATGFIAPELGAPRIAPNYRGKGLQVQFTIDDPGVFTTSWSASVTYRRSESVWYEDVCADNPHDYITGKDTPVPRADKPDF